MNECELAIRRLRYRLNRQGMLELDAWLSGLLQADFSDATVVAELEAMLACEPTEIQAMMSGKLPVPESLRRWLR